uniref:MADF domain-containing protein n=1 Tax=Caenorhabditis tropicalis TaxID=1561998 RepID=A0A1I7V3T6_9PELO
MVYLTLFSTAVDQEEDGDKDEEEVGSQEFKRRVDALLAIRPSQSFKGMSRSEMAVWYYGYNEIYRDKKIGKIWKRMGAAGMGKSRQGNRRGAEASVGTRTDLQTKKKFFFY